MRLGLINTKRQDSDHILRTLGNVNYSTFGNMVTKVTISRKVVKW